MHLTIPALFSFLLPDRTDFCGGRAAAEMAGQACLAADPDASLSRFVPDLRATMAWQRA